MNTHRLSLDFSEDAFNRLTEIRNLAKCNSNAKTVSNALCLYEWFLNKKNNGFSILVEKDDVYKEMEIVFP